MINKKIKSYTYIGLILSVFVILGFFTFASPALAMTCNSATLTGTVVTGTPPTNARFFYSTNYNTLAGWTVGNQTGTPTTVQTFTSEGTFPIQQFVSGLSESTTYYFRLVVTNNYGTQALNINNFTTPACQVVAQNQRPIITLLGSNPVTITVGQAYNDAGATAYDNEDGNITYKINKSGYVNTGSAGTYTITYNVSDSQGLSATPVTRTVTVNTAPIVTQKPSVFISANPTNVAYGGSSTITWNSTNATSCTASGGSNGWAGSKALSGNFPTGALFGDMRFNIVCNNGNETTGDGVTVFVSDQQIPPPVNIPNPTVSIYPNPTNINSGGQSVINWNSSNATSCTASGGSNGWAGSKALSGNFQTGALFSSTSYIITCMNSVGSVSASTSVNINSQTPTNTPNPTVIIYPSPSNVSYGGSSIIVWNSTNATSCTASGGSNGWAGNQNTSGSFASGTLYSTTSYSIVCTNSAGSSSGATVVTVANQITNPPYIPPYVPPYIPIANASVTITADRTYISSGENTTIRWYPSNATSCYGSGGSGSWAGVKNTFSDIFYTGPLYYTTTYTISCSNYGGGIADIKSVTIQVGQATTPTQYVYLSAITSPATSVTTSSAQLNGLILNSATNYPNTNAYFEWGTASSSLINQTPITNLGSQASTRHASFLTGLSSNRTYYFRVVAENSYGKSLGSILSFRTESTSTRTTTNTTTTRTNGNSLVLVTSSVDRNQPIVPNVDNSRPRPGDEINYTINYQNIGTSSISGLILRLDLPTEVNYMFSNPNNPTISGNTLIFNLGTMRANTQGTVTVRVKVKENVADGTFLNFPATLSYIDASGNIQSASANVTAQVVKEDSGFSLGANVIGADFLPGSLFGWLFLIILILLVVLIAQNLLAPRVPRQEQIEH